MNFYFPRKPWLWGWQKGKTYIALHFGTIDVLITWTPRARS